MASNTGAMPSGEENSSSTATRKHKMSPSFWKRLGWLIVIAACLVIIFAQYKEVQFISDDEFLLSGRSANTTGTITQMSTAMDYSSSGLPPTSLICHGKVAFRPAGSKLLTVEFDGQDWGGSACANIADGSQVVVLYNPHNPIDAGIEDFVRQGLSQALTTEILFGSVIGGIIIFNLIYYLVAWLKRLRKRRKASMI